ncbi:MAG: hypothetical protein PUC65_00770 [Clostridiales bacterium]|nr:hypothetical protein [Clostridiales bacterium]
MKKSIILLDTIVSVLAVGCILIDLCFMSVPKWISLITMIILLSLFVLEWIKGKRLRGKLYIL